MSSGLPKGYRFWGTESRDAASICLYFCCIFVFATFDFKAFFAHCPWRDSPLCAKHRNRDGNSLNQSLTALTAPSGREPLAHPKGLRFSRKLYRYTKAPSQRPPSPGRCHFPQGTSCHAKNACRSRRFLRGTSFYYSLPHCLPVKNRRVVVARNTWPARSTVEGNSGWEGLQG